VKLMSLRWLNLGDPDSLCRVPLGGSERATVDSARAGQVGEERAVPREQLPREQPTDLPLTSPFVPR